MKVFLKYFAVPLAIAVIASILFIVDSLIAPQIIDGASFMWVAFAIWTIFYGATWQDRIKGFIGVIIGFGAGVVMNLITSSFSANLYTISISALIGVFVVNALVMMLDKTEKVWLNSLSGVFAGIFLTFSGLGQGLSPLASVSEAFIMLGIIALYAVFGMVCGFFSIFITNKVKARCKVLDEQNKK